MWSRRLLLLGLASAVVAAILALSLLWLLLAAIERTHAAAPLQIKVLVVFGAPAVLIYPIAWYAIIFRHRRYDVRDTWRLLVVSYVACCLFDFAVGGGAALYQGAIMAWQALAKSHSPFGLIFLFAPVGVAIFTAIMGALLAIPYAVAAAPVAFMHRALVLHIIRAGDAPSGGSIGLR